MHPFSVQTPRKSKVTLYFSSALGSRNTDLAVSWFTVSSLMCSTRSGSVTFSYGSGSDPALLLIYGSEYFLQRLSRCRKNPFISSIYTAKLLMMILAYRSTVIYFMPLTIAQFDLGFGN